MAPYDDIKAPENNIQHSEHQIDVRENGTERRGLRGFVANEDSIPKGYYHSPYFLGSMFAIGMGLLAGVAGFAYAAPILLVIDEDIGPSPYLTWVAIVYTLCVAVGLTLVGRLSDIFGRRYFFIGGAVLATIGSIVCATAKSIGALIGGTTLIGLAAATQLSFHFVTAELVPMRARFWSVSCIYMFAIPGSGFGPAVAEAFVVRYPSVGWRGVYYLLIGINVAALASWTFFYFPPTFHMKHGTGSKMQFVKNFDYIGAVLYTGGLLLFLMGLSWGGSLYPWKSAHVISAIVVGILCLVTLGFWESYGNLKEPLLPKDIMRNGGFIAAAFLLGIGAGVYYAFAIVWPQMVAVLYSNGDPIYSGYLSCIVGIAFITGQVSGGALCKVIGKVRYQIMVTLGIGGTLLACMSTCTPETKNRAIGLLFVACVLVGWTESVCLTLLTIAINNQQEIGTAGGIGASIRSATATVCATVYTVILSNRLAATIGSQVPAAVIKAGLPTTSVASLLAAFSVGTPAAFAAVKGITPEIIAVASAAYKVASADAYRTVFLATIAFSGTGVILSFFAPNVDDRMTGEIAATLKGKDELVVDGGKV